MMDDTTSTGPNGGCDRARAYLNDELIGLGERRRRARTDIDGMTVRIGALTTHLHECYYQPKAQSARLVGVSAPHLTEWISQAAAAGTCSGGNAVDVVPWLAGRALSRFVDDNGGIDRVIAAAHASDVLMASALPPARFLSRDEIRLPHLLIQCTTGQFVACDNVSVGNPVSTTGVNAAAALAGLGLSDTVVGHIVAAAFSDTTFDDHRAIISTSTDASRWPRFTTNELTAHGDSFVVELDADGYTAHPDRPSPLREWLDLLSCDYAPQWVRGPRSVRMYFDTTAATADGYTANQLGTSRRPTVYPLIISQGHCQLWVQLPQPANPTQPYPPELHALLATLGFYPADIDPRGAFTAWRAALGRLTPPFIDQHHTIRHSAGSPS